MNIAIIVDDLIQRGGQERLLASVSEIWPYAPIYTSQASQFWKEFYKKRNVKLITSFMQYLPFAQKLNRHYSPFLFHAMAFERFDLSNFDVVLSVSSRYAHFISTKPTTKHVCYMNSPGRMFWEPHDYFSNESFGIFSNLAKAFLSLPLSYLRTSDYVAAQKIDHILANSINSQKRAKKYYHRDSDVIYPFTDTSKFDSKDAHDEKYFVLITRLSAWKRVDVAVKACSKLGLKLKVIGEGPALENLKKEAGPTVEFLGYTTDKQKTEVLKNCTALIQTQSEDFGIVPLEAMASGKPVIAFGSGGVLETVVPGVTGEFFEKQTAESLENILSDFDSSKYDQKSCMEQAQKFDVWVFKESLKNYVENLPVV